MQSFDSFRLGILVLFSLGVLYVAAKAKSVQRNAKAAQLSAQDAAKSAHQADDIVKGIAQPVQRPPHLSDQRRAALYQVAADHYFSGNEILWAYLYYYFVGASVLALAWGSVYAANKADGNIGREVVLTTLASAGIALSVIWLCLLRRSNSYRHPLRNAASDAEKAVRNDIGPEGSFAVAQRHGEILGWSPGSTRFVVNAIPLLFVGVFLVLFLVVLWPHICRWTATKPNTALHPTAASDVLSGRG